jgi:hypothetical protein
MDALTMNDTGVWIVETSHGTHYVVDLGMYRAMRVPAEGRGHLLADNDWFTIHNITCKVGDRMRLACEGQSREDWYTWRLSTTVTEIRPWEDPDDAA